MRKPFEDLIERKYTREVGIEVIGITIKDAMLTRIESGHPFSDNDVKIVESLLAMTTPPPGPTKDPLSLVLLALKESERKYGAVMAELSALKESKGNPWRPISELPPKHRTVLVMDKDRESTEFLHLAFWDGSCWVNISSSNQIDETSNRYICN